MTLKDKDQAEELKLALFKDTLIADVHQNNETISYTYKNETLLHMPFQGLLHVDKGVQRLHMITTDDRVAELIEMTYKVTKDPKTPLLVTNLHTSSKDYVAWVQKQCEPNDDEGQFFNDDPFDKSKPIAHEAISKMEDHEKKEKAEAAKSNADLDKEAIEKSKEEEKAEEEEKKDDEERKLKENQSKADAEKEGATEEEDEKEAALKAKEDAEKKGIFKTSEEAEAAAQKKKKEEALALA